MDPLNRPTRSPWHDGERRLQAMLGVEARLAELGQRVIRDHLPEQHRQFYAQLPFIVIGSVDAAGWPWASLVTGAPGFLASPHPRVLEIDPVRDPADPVWRGIYQGAAVGLLGIELHTRRRNRLNGPVLHLGPDGIRVGVEHSFGNCPRYIRPRLTEPALDSTGTSTIEAETLSGLDADARTLIRNADTFFVASYADDVDDPPHRQVDVSHRGGEPGFVRLADDGTLTIPDYDGNRHFNTLGNILANPRAGLVFVDFDSGDVLQMAGEAGIISAGPAIAACAGAERLWTVQPVKVVRRRRALTLRFHVEPERIDGA
jgi:uncharacterized protein